MPSRDPGSRERILCVGRSAVEPSQQVQFRPELVASYQFREGNYALMERVLAERCRFGNPRARVGAEALVTDFAAHLVKRFQSWGVASVRGASRNIRTCREVRDGANERQGR